MKPTYKRGCSLWNEERVLQTGNHGQLGEEGYTRTSSEILYVSIEVSKLKGIVNLEGLRVRISVASLSTSSNTCLSSLYWILERPGAWQQLG